jgi:hypothetical protein
VIVSKSPRHLKLGADLQAVTKRMAFLSHFLLNVRQAAAGTNGLLEELAAEVTLDKNGRPEESQVWTHSLQTRFLLSSLTESLELAETELQSYRLEYEKLETELRKLRSLEQKLKKLKKLKSPAAVYVPPPPPEPVAPTGMSLSDIMPSPSPIPSDEQK